MRKHLGKEDNYEGKVDNLLILTRVVDLYYFGMPIIIRQSLIACLFCWFAVTFVT